MKTISLTKGAVALIDDEDFEKVSSLKWRLNGPTKTHRAYASTYVGNNRSLYMHRLITNAPKGMVVDHINGDGLDNRKSNLRICTNQENSKNRKMQKNNTSGYYGVYWGKTAWRADIKINGKVKHIGSFKDKIEAAKARDKYAIKYHKEFAALNFR